MSKDTDHEDNAEVETSTTIIDESLLGKDYFAHLTATSDVDKLIEQEKEETYNKI